MVVVDAGPAVVGVGRIVGVSAAVGDVTVTAAAVTLSGCVDMVVDADVTVVVVVMMFLWLLLRMIFLSAWQSCCLCLCCCTTWSSCYC